MTAGPSSDPASRSAAPPRGRAATRGRWAMRDYPAVGWLLLAVALVLLHPIVPHATWLFIHVLMLGAATHAVLVWSAYFAQALLKTPDSLDPRRVQNRRLWLLLLGTVAVLVGVPSGWPVLVALGATLVAGAVGWHAVTLVRRLRAALPARFRVTVHYYVAAAGCLVVGATLGSIMATEPGEAWMGRLIVGHTLAMGLGWLGLAVLGSLVTLWPTMLRTRMDDRAESLAHQALPMFVAGLAVVVGGACAGLPWAVGVGLVGYAAGALWWSRALLAPARRRPPHQFSTLSVTAGLVWFALVPVGVGWALLSMPDWAHLEDAYLPAAAAIVGGFVLQVLMGAMSFLVPAAIGGGPSPVRAAHEILDRWMVARVMAVNVGLVLVIVPAGRFVAAAGALAIAGAIAVFQMQVVRAVGAMVRARRAALVALDGR